MGASHDQTDLSLEQLQALVSNKKRAVTEQKLVRVIEAQDTQVAGDASGTELRPSRSPESWRGAQGQDRHFTSATLVPLDKTRGDKSPSAGESDGKKRYTWRDRILVAGEILALAAFLAILGASFKRVSDLNTEYQQAQQTRVSGQVGLPVNSPTIFTAPPTQATVSPTPFATPEPSSSPVQPTLRPTVIATQEGRAVLAISPPSTETAAPLDSATPATSATDEPADPATATAAALPGARPEQSETPETPASSSTEDPGPTATTTPSATPIPGVPQRILIPSIDVDAPIVEGDSWEVLKLGVGHRIGTALPGETGNMVLSAHNDIYGEIFRRLHKVEEGDLVVIHMDDEVYRYEVISNDIVSPSRVDLMDPTDTPILTLITCYPYMLDTHRVVVRASLVPKE